MATMILLLRPCEVNENEDNGGCHASKGMFYQRHVFLVPENRAWVADHRGRGSIPMDLPHDGCGVTSSPCLFLHNTFVGLGDRGLTSVVSIVSLPSWPT